MSNYEYVVSRFREPTRVDADWDVILVATASTKVESAMGEQTAHFPNTQLKMSYDDQSLVFIFRVEDQLSWPKPSTITRRPDTGVEFFLPWHRLQPRVLQPEMNL